MAGFGPIALYVGGSGEVRFKDVSYRDLVPLTEPNEILSSRFRMQRISDFYYACRPPDLGEVKLIRV